MSMKLTGTNVKKLPQKTRKKMEKTLERMEQTRNEDSVRMRQKAEEALKYYNENMVKANQVEKTLLLQLEDIRVKKMRTEGAIVALQRLLAPEKKVEENEK